MKMKLWTTILQKKEEKIIIINCFFLFTSLIRCDNISGQLILIFCNVMEYQSKEKAHLFTCYAVKFISALKQKTPWAHEKLAH